MARIILMAIIALALFSLSYRVGELNYTLINIEQSLNVPSEDL